jgi:hypothetical protein
MTLTQIKALLRCYMYQSEYVSQFLVGSLISSSSEWCYGSIYIQASRSERWADSKMCFDKSIGMHCIDFIITVSLRTVNYRNTGTSSK